MRSIIALAGTTDATTPAGMGLGNILLLVVFIALIYFMMIRPQRKKDKEDREMRAALTVGDEIITIGGVVGKVEKITEKTVVISTGTGRNKIEFLKTAIASRTTGSGKAETKKDTKAEPEEEKKPVRDKKVTPKKLTKKADAAEAQEAEAVAAEEASESEEAAE